MTSRDFYRGVIYQLEVSHFAYKDYQKTKYFINAKILFEINKNTLKYIIKNSNLIRDKDKSKFQILIRHYIGWMSQFEYMEKISKPALDDTFAFDRADGIVSYPSHILTHLKSVIEE